MKILKSGKSAHRFVCPRCGCRFIAYSDEFNIDMTTTHKIYSSFCPECRHPVEHKKYRFRDMFLKSLEF